jgi:hypothetical protein
VPDLCSADLQIKGHWTFVTLSCLKLDGIALIEILYLSSRRETAAMKEHIVAAIIGLNETESLLPHDFLDGPSHYRLLFMFEPASYCERSTAWPISLTIDRLFLV